MALIYVKKYINYVYFKEQKSKRITFYGKLTFVIP